MVEIALHETPLGLDLGDAALNDAAAMEVGGEQVRGVSSFFEYFCLSSPLPLGYSL